jgi:hypothetical protein
MSLSEKAQELADLRRAKEEQTEQLKEINKRIQRLSEHDIPELMAEQEISKFSVPGVGTIYTQMELRASVLKDDKETFHEWLRATGNEEIVVDYVHPQTLKAFIKECIENGKAYPEYVKADVIAVARLRSGT